MKINQKHFISTVVLGAALAVFANAGLAQNQGDDRGRRGADDRDRGHGADDRDHGRGADDRGRRDEKSDYRFRQEDRNEFSRHYQSNIRQWQKHPDKRHHLRAGEPLPSDYRSHLKPVPSSYYRNVPPPPPGYRLGYYDGYVVAYNPTTQIVADVLDLVDAATHR